MSDAQLTESTAIRNFVLGGNAKFTLRSKRTGTRYTYKLQAGDTKRNRTPYWLKVLTGQDNDASYTFAGTIWVEHIGASSIHIEPEIKRGKAAIDSDAPSITAFRWFFGKLFVQWDAELVLGNVDFYHAGNCARCGRTLTVPESIDSGFGPECIKHAGVFGNYREQ